MENKMVLDVAFDIYNPRKECIKVEVRCKNSEASDMDLGETFYCIDEEHFRKLVSLRYDMEYSEWFDKIFCSDLIEVERSVLNGDPYMIYGLLYSFERYINYHKNDKNWKTIEKVKYKGMLDGFKFMMQEGVLQ